RSGTGRPVLRHGRTGDLDAHRPDQSRRGPGTCLRSGSQRDRCWLCARSFGWRPACRVAGNGIRDHGLRRLYGPADSPARSSRAQPGALMLFRTLVHRPMELRSLRLAAALATAAMVLTTCGNQDPNPVSGPVATTTQTTPTPAAGADDFAEGS